MRVRKTFTRIAVCLVIVSLMVGGLQTTALSKPPAPKYIIVMIGDGMGYDQALAASYYRYGMAEGQVYNEFPVVLGMQTYSADGWGYDPLLAWSDFDYVKTRYTDSASAGTAMATGIKTYDAGIGVDVDGNPVGNVLEAAETVGKATGVVSSVQFSHATPASFVAHNVSRNKYSEIANEMLLDSQTDVIMGAGNPWYNDDGKLLAEPKYQYVGGQATWDALVAGTVSNDADGDGEPDPWLLVQDRAEFQALMEGSTPKRVVGVPQVNGTLQQGRSGDKMADAYVVPFTETIPTLTEMTLGAINVLDEDPDGFVLLVEGGAIDWAAHGNQGGRMIEEQIEFDKAVEAVVSWVEANSNWGETLLIVTGDHETGYLTGPGSDPTWQPLVNNGVGMMPGMEFHSGNHTNSLIALFAKGDDARLFRQVIVAVDPVRGKYVDNTSIAKVIFQVLTYR